MSLRMKAYDCLINRVPGIRARYHDYQRLNPGIHRLRAWCYLGALFLRYYILRQTELARDTNLPGSDAVAACRFDPKKYQKISPEALEHVLEAYDIISFDVFDTLLFRKAARPEDVFSLLQNELHYRNLKTIRRNAEWQARQKRYKQYRDYEVSLTEIWERVHELTELDEAEGMQAEIRCEKAVCYANPYFLRLAAALKEKGKRIILCSDMYLSADCIRALLADAGYPCFDACFVSCEYRCSKTNGGLFKSIRSQYGPGLRYVHLGDHADADVRMARRHGFDSIYYHRGSQATDEYLLSFQAK